MNINGAKQLEMGIGEVRPDDETYRVVVKVEKPVALRWHYDGEVTVDGLGFEIRQPEGRMISYIAGAATLTNEMHVQIGHRDRAGSLLPDERHGYLLAETSASIEHTITSMFYFTKDLEATLSWRASESRNEYHIPGAASFFTEEKRYTAASGNPTYRPISVLRQS